MSNQRFSPEFKDEAVRPIVDRGYNEHRHEHAVQRMCCLLDVSPGGFYERVKRPLSARAIEDQRLPVLIRASYAASGGVYGQRRVFQDLREIGETCGRHRVARIPKMAFTLLLDRSGSMASVISDVQQSANEFLNGLPPTAECAVASFNGGYDYHNDIYQSCNSGNFRLDTLIAEGGTDLYQPLISTYDSLNQSYFDNHQKAVIVITDGQIGIDDALRQQVEAAKNNTLTVVYFLGLREDRYLTGLADTFLHSTSDISQNLTTYFHSLSAAYRTQKVLSVQECTGGAHANP